MNVAEEYCWPGYDFKYHYSDALTNDEEHLNSVFYTGNQLILVLKDDVCIYVTNHKIEWQPIFYYIKVQNKEITYRELFRQLDEQTTQYKDILKYTNHHFIEDIVRINDLQYEIDCSS